MNQQQEHRHHCLPCWDHDDIGQRTCNAPGVRDFHTTLSSSWSWSWSSPRWSWQRDGEGLGHPSDRITINKCLSNGSSDSDASSQQSSSTSPQLPKKMIVGCRMMLILIGLAVALTLTIIAIMCWNASPDSHETMNPTYGLETRSSWAKTNVLSIFDDHHDHQPHAVDNTLVEPLLDAPSDTRRLQSSTTTTTSNMPLRILYVVTTLAEKNSGSRSTVRGSDRLQETLIPVVSEGIRSMLREGYHVDLFLVCHFDMLPDRLELVRQALPDSVGLQVWNDATPMGYDTMKEPNFTKLVNRTQHLSRQHRFVIKDKIRHYDMFVNFEDDMLITGEHVNHFRAVTSEIERLIALAPDQVPLGVDKSNAEQIYHGIMTKDQLRRTIPGFIRVEVLLNESTNGAQSDTGPVPVDMDFGPGYQTEQVNSQICCHVSDRTANEHIPVSPTADQLMLWETNIFPLGVRRMPDRSWLDWVATLRGSAQGDLNVSSIIGDYWSNRNYYYWPNERRRPAPLEFKYINNQGGWMATRKQLWRWHTEICPGGFLPPYEAPHYRYDGLDARNVEWYSGGMQLSTVRHACNMQRIVLLQPEYFSKSLIYHSANNKQKQLSYRKESSFIKANTLLGQLNTIRKRAIAEMK